MQLIPADYHKNGLFAEDWESFSPTAPSAWHAFTVVKQEPLVRQVFLGAGYSALNVDPTMIGEFTVATIGGLVYIFDESGTVSCPPSRQRGYLHRIFTSEVLAYTSDFEILLISDEGHVRYEADVAIDDFRIVSIDGNTVTLSGVREYGADAESWCVTIDDIASISDL